MTIGSIIARFLEPASRAIDLVVDASISYNWYSTRKLYPIWSS